LDSDFLYYGIVGLNVFLSLILLAFHRL
jgi:hypothetical protein